MTIYRGYTVWHDAKPTDGDNPGWRYTSPDGSEDSPTFPSEDKACDDIDRRKRAARLA